MRSYSIKSTSTAHQNILKFEANHFLVQNDRFKFTNADEALLSPLAQKLFKLPFVAQLFLADNYVAIKIKDNFLWDDYAEAVSKKITNYLNAGHPILAPNYVPSQKKIPVSVYAEMAPSGPGELKFVCGKKLVINRIQHLYNETVGEQYALTRALFQHFSYVKRIIIEDNYLLLTKGKEVEWNMVMPALRDFIRLYLMQRKPVIIDE